MIIFLPPLKFSKGANITILISTTIMRLIIKRSTYQKINEASLDKMVVCQTRPIVELGQSAISDSADILNYKYQN